jgi:hypothetical protein
MRRGICLEPGYVPGHEISNRKRQRCLASAAANRAGPGLLMRAEIPTHPDADRGTPADTINEAIDAEF